MYKIPIASEHTCRSEIVALVIITSGFCEAYTRTTNISLTQKASRLLNLIFPQVLCGCGALDGTEISEAISLAINLTSNGLKPEFFAPDINQCGVMDHFCKEPDKSGTTRNALVEAARIARSGIRPLSECDCNSGVALVIPGGFGCAKTLLVDES